MGATLKGDGCVQMKSNLKHNACHEIVTRREEEIQRNAIFFIKYFLLKVSSPARELEISKSYVSVKIFN